MAQDAPIKKFVVLTHLVFHEIDFMASFRKQMLEQLAAIIDANRGDPGVHFIVSHAKRSQPDPDVHRLLDAIPHGRVHWPISRNSHWGNFFEDDHPLHERLSRLGIAKTVDIESFGDYTDGCSGDNTRQVADYVAGRSEIGHITMLGGASSSEPLTRLAQGETLDQAEMKHARSHSEFELGKLGRMMGPHAAKLEIAWPTKYKMKRPKETKIAI